jgi:hypothetical protein
MSLRFILILSYHLQVKAQWSNNICLIFRFLLRLTLLNSFAKFWCVTCTAFKPCLHVASWLARVKFQRGKRTRFMQIMESSAGWNLKRIPTSIFYLHERSARILGSCLARANLHRVNATVRKDMSCPESIDEFLHRHLRQFNWDRFSNDTIK